MRTQTTTDPYTIYVVNRDGTAIDTRPEPTTRDAMARYRKLAALWTVADGYEVCVYRGDDEMIASTWPASER